MGRSRRHHHARLQGGAGQLRPRLLGDRRIQQHRPCTGAKFTDVINHHSKSWPDDDDHSGKSRRIRTRRMDAPRRRHRGRHSTTHTDASPPKTTPPAPNTPASGRKDLRVLHPCSHPRLRLCQRGHRRQMEQIPPRLRLCRSSPGGETKLEGYDPTSSSACTRPRNHELALETNAVMKTMNHVFPTSSPLGCSNIPNGPRSSSHGRKHG